MKTSVIFGTLDSLSFESKAATYIANTDLRYRSALADFLQDNEGGNVTATDVQTFLAGEKNKFEKELQAFKLLQKTMLLKWFSQCLVPEMISVQQ